MEEIEWLYIEYLCIHSSFILIPKNWPENWEKDYLVQNKWTQMRSEDYIQELWHMCKRHSKYPPTCTLSYDLLSLCTQYHTNLQTSCVFLDSAVNTCLTWAYNHHDIGLHSLFYHSASVRANVWLREGFNNFNMQVTPYFIN